MIIIKENLNFKSTICNMGIPEEKISENTLELFSLTDEFDILYDTIKAALLRKKYSLAFIRDIMHCLDEAFSNAIVWGNKNDVKKNVTVKYYINKDFCVISLHDHGEGFDVRGLINSAFYHQVTHYPIRGLYFINKYVDKVFFNEVGNKIMIVKYNNVMGG